MTPVWLIETDVFGDSFDALKTEIRQRGMVWELVQPRPFLNGLAPEVRGHRLTEKDCVVFSGTYPLMRHIQLHFRWVPGGWCTAENFDCPSYYPHFGPHLFNHNHAILTVEEALSQADELFARFAKDDRLFVRPCGVGKTFTGRCVSREKFDPTLGSARHARTVLVAPPREIAAEWRLVVSRDRVVAASRYRTGDQLDVAPGCPREVTAFVDMLLAQVPWRPDPIFMMDVCRSGKALYLIELNSFSCSGLYQCDPAAVVEEVKSLAVAEWQRV